MTLETAWQVEQVWGSHQPVLKAVLEILKPLSVVECGCGYFSTPLMHSHSSQLLILEHDSFWAHRMMKEFPKALDKHLWKVFPISGHNGTKIEELPGEEVQRIKAFYEQVMREIKSFDLLFVDTYCCARVLAFQILQSKASFIILHDVEPLSIPWYGYHQLEEDLKGWEQYLFRPEGCINQAHKIPWTLLCAKQEISPEQLQLMSQVTIRESQRLWNMDVSLEPGRLL